MLQNIKHGLKLAKKINFLNYKVSFFLLIYYSISALNTLLEGVGIILIVDFFINSNQTESSNDLVLFIKNYIQLFGLEISNFSILLLISVIFLLRIFTNGFILITDNFIHAKVRRKLQESIFLSYINGNWDHTKNLRVGGAVNTLTLEVMHVEKYFFAFIKSLYFLITSVILLILCILISYKITFILGLIAIPFFIVLHFILKIQSKLSKEFVAQRNIFGADVSERISNLLQIKVENSENYHFKYGIKSQPKMFILEMMIGLCTSFVGLFIVILPLFVFLFLLLWTYFLSIEISLLLAMIATIGIMGVRALTQINGLINFISSISRYEGSLIEAVNSFKIPQSENKKLISDDIRKIRVESISYSFGSTEVFKEISFEIRKGKLFYLQGKSGSGKTTIANILSGIINPKNGSVIYCSKNNEFDSRVYRANVAYVTQDILTFKGSVRENLINDKQISDNEIWKALKKVGADKFISENGGLSSELMEAGKSLSGGQRRRLGIARALLKKADIIILDEITAGLDMSNLESIKDLIIDLSKDKLVFLISHDVIEITDSDFFSI